ncbi:MAG TPA: glycosyltransferase family 9 protein [Candidatus Kapabacteria bacterium]
MLIHHDCRHFRGDIPCVPNKREGVHCDGCPHYDPITENVLIVKLGAAGDVLRTTPILTPLKEEHPNARIWWLTYSPELVPKSKVDRILKWTSENIEILRALKFARILNLDKDHYACALASSLDAKKKDGFLLGKFGEAEPANKRAEEKFLTGIFDDVSLQNHKDYPTELFEVCGYEFKGESYMLDIPQPEAFPSLDASRPLIGLNTGAGARWTSRLWPIEDWVELANKLHASGKNIVLLGGPDEDARNREIHRRTEGRAQYIGFFQLTQFIALMQHCELIVTGVTMGMHIAIALKKKLVLMNNIFNPYEFGNLYGLGEIVQPDAQCKCFFRGTCINPEYFCLDRLSVEKMFDAIERVWNTPNGNHTQAPLVMPGMITV